MNEREVPARQTDTAPRTVLHADAVTWLRDGPIREGCSFVTSLPDVSELSLPLEAWRTWFDEAARLVLTRCPEDGVAIFFQTDIKKAGVWIDKGYLVQKAAEQVGSALLWHKIVPRTSPGTATFGRPAYSHLLCFSRSLRLHTPLAQPDVLADGGERIWTRGMGVHACLLACRFVRDATPTRTVVDPFCGKGTVLAAANALGLQALGVELSAKRARQARALGWPPRRGTGPTGCTG